MEERGDVMFTSEKMTSGVTKIDLAGHFSVVIDALHCDQSLTFWVFVSTLSYLWSAQGIWHINDELWWWPYPRSSCDNNRSTSSYSSTNEALDTARSRYNSLREMLVESRFRIVYGVDPPPSLIKASTNSSHQLPAIDNHTMHQCYLRVSGTLFTTANVATMTYPCFSDCDNSEAHVMSTILSMSLHTYTGFQDLEAQGLVNVLPRVSFFLVLACYMETLPHLVASDKAPGTPPAFRLKKSLAAIISFLMPCRILTPSSPRALLSKLRQPIKLSLALTIASILALSSRARGVVGPGNYWAAIVITKIMTPFPTSSFNSAVSRIFGTAVGAAYAITLLEWFNIRDGVLFAILMALWIFFCRYGYR